MGIRIFLSYGSPSDAGWAAVTLFRDRLEARLRETTRRDVDVLIDKRVLTAGRPLAAEIERRVCDADCVIWLLTESWLTSDWCNAELAFATRAGIPGLPLTWAPIDDTRLPKDLRGLLRVDMSGAEAQLGGGPTSREAIDQIVGQLVRLVPALARPGFPPRARRRRLGRAAAAVLVLLSVALQLARGVGQAPEEPIAVVELRGGPELRGVLDALAGLRPSLVALTQPVTEIADADTLGALLRAGIPVVGVGRSEAGIASATLALVHESWMVGGGYRGVVVDGPRTLPLLVAGVTPPRLAREVWFPRRGCGRGECVRALTLQMLSMNSVRGWIERRSVIVDLPSNLPAAQTSPWGLPWEPDRQLSDGLFVGAIAAAARAHTAWWGTGGDIPAAGVALLGGIAGRARPLSMLAAAASVLLVVGLASLNGWGIPAIPILVVALIVGFAGRW